MNTADYRLGLVLVTGSAVAWSTAGFFTRLIGLDTWTLLAWRGLFGALALAVVSLAMNRERGLRAVRGMGLPGWSFAVVSAIGMILFVASLRQTTVAHVAVIYATVPFIAAGFAWLALGEKPGRSAIVASLVALAGVVLTVGVGAEGGIFGDGLALGMTVCVASMMVLARRCPTIPFMPAACLSALLSGLASWPLGAPLAVSGHDLILLAAFGSLNSAVGLALFAMGARRLPAIETALIGALDAPLAPLWVWLAFNETPAANTIFGGTVVFAAVAAHVAFGATRRTLPAAAGSGA